MFKPLRFLLCVLALLSCFCPLASAQILTNGGFETGDFTGWTRVNRPLGAPYDPNVAAQGQYVIDNNDGQTPLSGLSALGPKSGSFYAISDMTAQGTHALLQSFTAPTLSPGQSLIFSYDMYVYDYYGNGAAIDPSGLDHTTGGTNQPNQHARVDLLRMGAGAFDTSSQSVVSNFYQGVDNPAGSTAAPQYISYRHDITNLVTAGQTYQVRFATVDNQFVLNQGVDNVSLSAVPEPGSWALLLSSGIPLALAARLRRRRHGRHNRL